MKYRCAERPDYAALADMRWRLKAEDAPFEHDAAYRDYISAFVTWAEKATNYVHWVADDNGKLRGAMSIAMVPKVPAPDEPDGRWGYLTNSYVYPDARNSGVGGALLDSVVDRARSAGLELLVVWPSERAYPFYERGGFQSQRDPLMLEF